jgi:hypothetical protein
MLHFMRKLTDANKMHFEEKGNAKQGSKKIQSMLRIRIQSDQDLCAGSGIYISRESGSRYSLDIGSYPEIALKNPSTILSVHL